MASILPGLQVLHLGLEDSCGPYCTAIQDGGAWWAHDDANELVKLSALSLVAQENWCLLWLNCTPLGGAGEVYSIEENSQLLTVLVIERNFTHDPTIKDIRHGQWLPELDLLNTYVLVDNPNVCQRLEKKCIKCGSWPELPPLPLRGLTAGLGGENLTVFTWARTEASDTTALPSWTVELGGSMMRTMRLGGWPGTLAVTE